MPSGRYAPSPTGRLHLGNLRTALLAWLFARAPGPDGTSGGPFRLRFDDLDQAAVRAEHYDSQAADLAAIGLDWDGPIVRQSERVEHYRGALDRLRDLDVLYPCFCSRREIREAAQAPNRPLAGHHYPGTCRRLDTAARRARGAEGRRPAWRLRTEQPSYRFVDRLKGPVTVELDDFVVERNDGTPAYHLVTVVDDDALGVELVVRADDLLDSTGRQLLVAELLGCRRAEHAHVPLVLGPDGQRLAKRHGSVTLDERAAAGETPIDVLRTLARSLHLPGAAEATRPDDLLPGFDPADLPTSPLTLDP
ncbi:MAG: tRNA glutamyl-Q(34) synthetase GluQRS [Actinomycetota bacterium]